LQHWQHCLIQSGLVLIGIEDRVRCFSFLYPVADNALDLLLALGVYKVILELLGVPLRNKLTKLLPKISAMCKYAFDVLNGACIGESTDSDVYLSRGYRVCD
jgi:hypothetical protein